MKSEMKSEMSREKQSGKIPGVSREDEIKMLARILSIADGHLNRIRASVQGLQNELHELKEVYDAEDKEGLAQWFNTDARFQQVRQDLLRAERSRKKPYFGRIDFVDSELKMKECYYIGKTVIAKDQSKPEVIDWRAPIASVYYEKSLGKCTYSVKGEGAFEIDLSRKRTYEIDEDKLKDYYDSDVVANDELLTKYLARNKRAVLSEIIATIQQEQNEIIRKKPQHNVIVQGGAGSGKTTVAMHRISYILYNYELEFKPKDFYIIGSNRILLNYITGILPDLDVYGVSQMTMEQLLIRLLYEEWDEKKYTVKSLNKGDPTACIKGSFSWFQDLEGFCRRYEWAVLPREDVLIEKTKRLLMPGSLIEKLLIKFDYLSLADKRDKLTEHLLAKLENEIYGKYYTYPPNEQKALTKYFQTYFGKREWKGSIFDLYHEFLAEQSAKGKAIDLPDSELDLYDLAALAYLYKRIKETDVIQEASHVVIDEAQDFGMMVYGALRYCLSNCTFTIMGDVSQNIYFDYGLSDWEELKSLMLPGEFDYFGLLKKSYRNTVEIAEFAGNILQHGSFPVYPVEPIIRHGKGVEVVACGDDQMLISEAAETILRWQEEGFETIAVICREEGESAWVSKNLGSKVKLREFNLETEEFGNGVMVLPIEYSKGLEFDAVLLFNVSEENYPAQDGYAKLLYVAATRALHELKVLHTGKVTDLIGAPVPKEKKFKTFTEQPKKRPRIVLEEDSRTKRDIELELARDGHKEMEHRNLFGPKRIEAQKPKNLQRAEAENDRGTGRVRISSPTGIRIGKEAAVKAVPVRAKGKSPVESSEFATMPDSTSLRPLGHSTFQLTVRWVAGNQDYVEVTNAYGVLRLIPISDDTVRILFARDGIREISEVPAELSTGKKPVWKYRDSRDQVELTTARLLVRADKKTGALSFQTPGGTLLLGENTRFPRQIEKLGAGKAWTYFDWSKKEILKARGITDDRWLELSNTARYISHGTSSSNRPSCLMSNRGYQIFTPPGTKTMVCTLSGYGPYLYTEGKEQIDYFFRTAGK